MQYCPVNGSPGGPSNTAAGGEGEPPAPSTQANGAAGLARAALGTFSPSRVPAMARHNYRRELIAACSFPFALVLFEGSVLSVLVRIGFEGQVSGALLNAVSALISVVPALANLSSFFWVRLAHGQHKIRAITRVQAIMLVAAFGMALAPRNAFGLILIAVAALTARTCWAGFSSIRSTVWRNNYRAGVRARITGRFAMVGPTLIALLSLGLGLAIDLAGREHSGLGELLARWGLEPSAGDLSWGVFRVAVPVGCVLGIVGLWSWSGIRVREHRRLLRLERETDAGEAPSFNPIALVNVVRKDRDYDKFMTAQLLLGLGNITTFSLLAIVLREYFGAGYFRSLVVTTAISLLVMPMAVPFWAKMLDGMHIARFRAYHSWVFVVSIGVLFAACWTRTFWPLYVFAALRGVAFGGGALGWTLGHLDFASDHNSSNYMGVHVTLTGVRGVLAGVGGVTLYEGLERVAPGAGVWVFVLCGGLTTLGALGFVALSRDLRKRGKMGPRGRRITAADADPGRPTAQG
ncbi:MAG: hypothetical protein DHS20C14_16370 [Phycisphaeraceae bacterium]|nr:MAG: hypothetical protein DHS20C14_16370 [Phycisphaeraceae bacterium]